MLIQTSLQISPLNRRAPAEKMWVSLHSSASIARGFMGQAGLCHKVGSEVLILSIWFCPTFSSSSLSSLDPSQPGRKLEFQGERLIGTKTSLAADRRRNQHTRSAKAFRIRSEVPQARQDSSGMQWREKGGRGESQQSPKVAPGPPRVTK